MALMMGDLRAALVEAGASEGFADKAATEVAAHETRLDKVEGRLALLIWMVGFNLTATVGILAKLIHG